MVLSIIGSHSPVNEGFLQMLHTRATVRVPSPFNLMVSRNHMLRSFIFVVMFGPAIRDAHAQEVVPSAGVATENGPGTLWVNPANLAYDRDPRWGLFFRSTPDSPHPYGGAVTAGIAGFSGGVRWNRNADNRNDFAVDLGLGVQLPRRIALGGNLHWNLVADRSNFVSFDLSASWRPLPWIGVSAITRNIGNPGGPDTALPQTGFGLGVRPLGRTLLLGTDLLYTFGATPDPTLRFNTRVRLTEGMFLRGSVDSKLRAGAGLEMVFGGVAAAAHLGSSTWEGRPEVHAWLGSDEPNESLSRSRRQVTELALTEELPYRTNQRLLRDAPTTWLDTLEHFRSALEDPHVRGMVVTLGGAPMSWARWQEVRGWIRMLEAADKPVTAYLTGGAGGGAVYASSAASKVWVHPATTLDLTELSLELVHLRGLLDVVGVDIQVVRRSEYKSAAEPLVALEPSSETLEQQRALLDATRQELVEGLATGRRRTTSDVEDWLSGGPWTAIQAVETGIADGRAYPDQLDAHVDDLHGATMRHIDLAETPVAQSPWDAPAGIGVVYVEGTIVSGESSPPGLLSGRTTGSATLHRELERLATDVTVRAVVMRIDSPGGSAFASDEIWRSVELVKAAGKPVVVSMGGVAASGGYYVSAGADAIWAEPGTVTGSIGVLALKTSMGPLLDTLQVRSTILETGRNGAMDSNLRPWDPLQLSRMDNLVADTYRRFKERVARGRSMTAEEVEAVARGRVWSGAAARELGLVDHLGGLSDALAHARELAGIPEARPVSWVDARDRPTLVGQLLPGAIRLGGRGIVDMPGAVANTLAPVGALWTLTQHGEETLWMIDPWWTQMSAR